MDNLPQSTAAAALPGPRFLKVKETAGREVLSFFAAGDSEGGRGLGLHGLWRTMSPGSAVINLEITKKNKGGNLGFRSPLEMNLALQMFFHVGVCKHFAVGAKCTCFERTWLNNFRLLWFVD